MIEAVCVYCGSAAGADPAYTAAARSFARMLAGASLTLVYGGGKVGLMGILADEMLACGGKAIGVIPERLLAKEVGHQGLTELHVVRDMHERKMKMADLADAFVALPGGVGTYEELFETYTWAQLGYHAKPLGLLNTQGYYEPLLALLRHTVQQGFMNRGYVDVLQVDTDAGQLLAKLRDYRAPHIDKWAAAGRDAI
jgi:uncharacterized protein (TIGR00730 family)